MRKVDARPSNAHRHQPLPRPLAEAVALDEAEMGDEGQRDGFGNECEGRCGL